ncbi:MAG: hypothetical protein V9G24_18420 [Rhodoblastus sp.]
MIEGQRREAGSPPAAVDEEGELLDRKIVRRNPRQQLRQGFRILRHLHHGAIARRDDRRQRAETEVEREIPRHDHADDAERLRNHAIPGQRIGHEIDAPALRLHPFLQMLDGVADRLLRDEEFGEQRLELAAVAVVGVDRRHDLVAVLLQEPPKRFQVGDALVVGGFGRGEIGGALPVETFLKFCGNGDLADAREGSVHGGLLRKRGPAAVARAAS